MTPTQDYGSYGTGAVLIARQNSIVGITGGGSNVNLPGCVLTLTPGLWLVTGHFTSGRIWQSGTGYASTVLRGYLTGPSGTALAGSPHGPLSPPYPMFNAFCNCQNEQRASLSPVTLTTTVELTANMNVELWGGADMVVGSNFAGGWRWDSGTEQPCSLEARKLR